MMGKTGCGVGCGLACARSYQYPSLRNWVPACAESLFYKTIDVLALSRPQNVGFLRHQPPSHLRQLHPAKLCFFIHAATLNTNRQIVSIMLLTFFLSGSLLSPCQRNPNPKMS